jgi:molybdopterin-guanine dinucleotide biosynthesis protein A
VHPLLGVVTALERAGEPVVAIACDMPFVPPDLLARLAAGPAAAVHAGGMLQPFPARYEPAALARLQAALARGDSMRAALAALDPETFELADAGLVANINTPEELAAAERA